MMLTKMLVKRVGKKLITKAIKIKTSANLLLKLQLEVINIAMFLYRISLTTIYNY